MASEVLPLFDLGSTGLLGTPGRVCKFLEGENCCDSSLLLLWVNRELMTSILGTEAVLLPAWMKISRIKSLEFGENKKKIEI